MNLLLVDDDRLDRMTTIRALSHSETPIEVIEAVSAEEGLFYASQHEFDIILLDYQLPTMNGLELLNEIRNSTSSKSAIAMLSHCEDEKLALSCIEAGAQDFITKNEVNTSRLMRSIMQAKERYRFEKELVNNHEEMKKLAETDILTGLANRYVFETSLKDAIPEAEKLEKKLALLMLDLDKFKIVNDTLGHDAGDQLLKIVAERLRAPVRDGDILCRLGGDEFAILVKNIDQPRVAQKVADRILQALRKPMRINGIEVVISASVGIATYPENATDAVQLMKCADMAMYRSKESGRNQYYMYSQELHENIQQLFQLERDLYRAIQEKEFVLYYQPQIDTKTLNLKGMEALIRWDCPQKGIVSPAHFIPAAEEMGLINELGLWVLETAISQLSFWRCYYNAEELDLSMAVNLSAKQLGEPRLLHQICNLLEKYHVPPRCLELELTESAMNNTKEANEMLSKLTNLGIRLALDDFGTGYSSLFQLQKNPFQILKIDKTFINIGSSDSKDLQFLNAINAFAKTLGIETVAEGVETETQLKTCESLEFDRMQGYHFGKPLPPEALEALWLFPKLPKCVGL